MTSCRSSSSRCCFCAVRTRLPSGLPCALPLSPGCSFTAFDAGVSLTLKLRRNDSRVLPELQVCNLQIYEILVSQGAAAPARSSPRRSRSSAHGCPRRCDHRRGRRRLLRGAQARTPRGSLSTTLLHLLSRSPRTAGRTTRQTRSTLRFSAARRSSRASAWAISALRAARSRAHRRAPSNTRRPAHPSGDEVASVSTSCSRSGTSRREAGCSRRRGRGSAQPSRPRVGALPRREHRRGDADVERATLPRERDRDLDVARPPDERPYALALGTEARARRRR